MKKRMLAILLLFAVCLTTIPLAQAYDRDGAVIGDSISWAEIPDTLEGSPAPAEGFDPQPMNVAGGTVQAPVLFSAAPSWTLKDGVLTVSASGDMEDYSMSSPPGWYDQREQITSVIVADTCTSIGNMAFLNCYNLTSVSISNKVTSIGEAAFYGCSNLSSVSLPASVKSLGSGAFYGCYGLSAFSGPGLTEIGDYAFEETGLRSFTIPKTLSSIGMFIFMDTGIERLEVEAGSETYKAVDGVLFSKDEKKLLIYPAFRAGSAYTVPAGVETVGTTAFGGAANLSEVNLNQVFTLESSAFQNSSITSITLPDSLMEVDMFTFYNCRNLRSIKFGRGLKSTSYEMFEQCTGLTDIDFGTALQELDARTFAYCGSLQSVTLPQTVKAIGNASFGECTALESVTAYGLTEIPFQAFLNDRCLAQVNLNEGVTDIYRYSFHGCDNLKSVTLPASVKFADGVSLNSVT